MIRIDLREIPIFVLNMEEDHERKAFMTEQLNALGLEHRFISAVKCDPVAVGITLSHLKTLRQEGLKPPFLILEDDCKILPHRFAYWYDLPQETDALYLGHSVFGLREQKDEYGVRWGQQGNTKYKHYNENYIRVFSMLSRHAILYVSERYFRNAIAANLSALLDYAFSIPGDIMYAEMQPEHLVLSVREISCYQTEEFGGIEAGTNISLLTCIPPYKGT